MQDTENNKKISENDDWMFDNPFMNKVATKGGGYTEMARPASIIPESEPVSETEAEMDIDFDPYELTEADCYKSLTPFALQAPGWRTPTEFPCCPNDVSSDGLKEYKENMKPGLMFSSNQYGKYYVINRAFHPKRNCLLVLAKNEQEDGYYGTYSVAMIEIKFNKFVHYSVNRFGHESDATKFYKSIIGEYELTDDERILYWES